MAKDTISTLPDVILCHILSFVPTKQAVVTSLLSKRWRHLWRSVTTLDFCNMSVSGKKATFRFNQFVHSVLLSRDADHPIKSFHLHFQDAYPDRADLGFANVVKWVNIVVQRRVEYLHLELLPESWPKLPISILTCRTLVVLKLEYLSLKGLSSVALPSLKNLYLECILFSKVPDFMLLLSGCPNLEDLHVLCVAIEYEERSEWKSFSLSKLIRAEIVDSCFHFPLKALQNVESLRIEIAKVYVSNDVIPIFHNLTHLNLITCVYFKWNMLAELLKHCPKLQSLDLDQSDMDEYWTGEEGEDIWVDPEFVPQCLSLHLRTCNRLSFVGLKGEFLFARYIMKNARFLQTIEIWNKGETSINPRASATCKLTVLLSRDADLPNKSFRLLFRHDYLDCAYLGFANVVKWVNFVVQCRVEYLHLQVTQDWPRLPISILTCRTLVVLKLDTLSLEGFSSVALPSLKTLHFEYIFFSKVPDFMLLLAGCPNIEDILVIGVSFEYEHSSEWNFLAEVLKHCPKLQRLDLDQSDIEGMHYWTGEEGEHIWVDPGFVPQCLSLHLRTCNLLGFLGLKGELLFARHILKNASVLQTMGIWNKGQTDINRLLSSCPRASATCKLTVYDDRPYDELVGEDDDVAEE